jgi:hypothetical protein
MKDPCKDGQESLALRRCRGPIRIRRNCRAVAEAGLSRLTSM